MSSRNKTAMLPTMHHRLLLERLAELDDYDDSPCCSGYEHVYFKRLRLRNRKFYDTLSARNTAQPNAIFQVPAALNAVIQYFSDNNWYVEEFISILTSKLTQ